MGEEDLKKIKMDFGLEHLFGTGACTYLILAFSYVKIISFLFFLFVI